jgi:ribose 5-phosphate isomerase A
MAISQDAGKRAAARAAADAVPDGARLGLGTGSTVRHLLERLAERVRDDGLRIEGIPTSVATADQARRLGIALTSFDEVDRLDLTIDGADEVDPDLELIKGGGGALTREKIVAAASTRMEVIVDRSKLVDRLGATFRLPIEVLEFGWRPAVRRIRDLGLEPDLRPGADSAPFRTDNGNLVLDATLPPTPDLRALETALRAIPGVVEVGLFLGMAQRIWVGTADGAVETMERSA